jgi:hypothetical protein
MMMMSPAAQQELLAEMGSEEGNRLMEHLTRGQANVNTAGRGQRMSTLGGIEGQAPNV